MFSANPASYQPISHSLLWLLPFSLFPSIHSFIMHTIISSSYPFTPLHSSHYHLLSHIIPALSHLSVSNSNLLPPALSLHQHVPPGLWVARVPPWARALRDSEILMASGEGHLQHTLQGVQARPAESEWVNFSNDTGKLRQMEARWSEANEEKWWSVCVCVKAMLSQLPAGFFTCIRWFASRWSGASSKAVRVWHGCTV